MKAQLTEQIERVYAFKNLTAKFSKEMLDKVTKERKLYKKVQTDVDISNHVNNQLALLLEAIVMMEMHLGYLLDGFAAKYVLRLSIVAVTSWSQTLDRSPV